MKKRTLFQLDDKTLAGERRKLHVGVPHHVDVVLTVDDKKVPLFPMEARQLAHVLLEHCDSLFPSQSNERPGV
jgi:hypothetical protein